MLNPNAAAIAAPCIPIVRSIARLFLDGGVACAQAITGSGPRHKRCWLVLDCGMRTTCGKSLIQLDDSIVFDRLPGREAMQVRRIW